MHLPKPNSEAGKPHKIQLTLTEAVALTALFGLVTLVFFGAFFALLYKHVQFDGIDWTVVLLLLSALLNLERTIKFAVLAGRTRRLVRQDRQMQERQKRAGWQ